jgi:hypothetical protein
MKDRIGHRVIVLAVVVGAAAILTAPGVAARPDDKPGMLGVGAVSASSERSANERATLVDSGRALRPDDRPGVRGPGAIGGQSVTLPTASGEDGFKWTAAGLGAGFVVALGLLGALLVASIRRFERHPA